MKTGNQTETNETTDNAVLCHLLHEYVSGSESDCTLAMKIALLPSGIREYVYDFVSIFGAQITQQTTREDLHILADLYDGLSEEQTDSLLCDRYLQRRRE